MSSSSTRGHNTIDRTLQETHGESTAAILVDFDNFYTNIAEEDEMLWLSHEVNAMISGALHLNQSSRRILIRIYGGWLENRLWTRRGSRLQKALFSTVTFPMPHPNVNGLLRGEITLATRLLQLPDIEWGHTLRSKAGPPRLRLAGSLPPEGCTTERITCPVKALQHFTRKKGKVCAVEGCHITNDEAFMVVEQKMVDTMMTCDLLALCQEPNVDAIMILSNDTDLLPPLFTGAVTSRKSLQLVNTRGQHETPYSEALRGIGVDLKVWET